MFLCFKRGDKFIRYEPREVSAGACSLKVVRPDGAGVERFTEPTALPGPQVALGREPKDERLDRAARVERVTGHWSRLIAFAIRLAKPGEHLFAFVRVDDRAPMSCELRCHGESFGWEAQFLKRGELFYSRGAFPTRELAIAWAEQERVVMERA